MLNALSLRSYQPNSANVVHRLKLRPLTNTFAVPSLPLELARGKQKTQQVSALCDCSLRFSAGFFYHEIFVWLARTLTDLMPSVVLNQNLKMHKGIRVAALRKKEREAASTQKK
jgi:hypothetical protein